MEDPSSGPLPPSLSSGTRPLPHDSTTAFKKDQTKRLIALLVTLRFFMPHSLQSPVPLVGGGHLRRVEVTCCLRRLSSSGYILCL